MNTTAPADSLIPSLRDLWKAAFGDTDDFLDDFFSTAYAPHRCRCIVMDDQVAAALYWLDCSCEGRKLAYIYAVATHPDHRGKGLCRTLMSETMEVLKQGGYDGVVLVPQKPGLIQMYAGMGFTPCSGVTEFHVMAGDPIPVRKIGVEEFARLRRNFLPKNGVIQENENLPFLSTQVCFYAGKNWISAVAEVDGMLWCPELLGDPDAAPGLVKSLDYREGSFRMPGDGRPFAMFRPLTEDCPRPAYFGFAFD